MEDENPEDNFCLASSIFPDRLYHHNHPDKKNCYSPMLLPELRHYI